MRQRIEVIIDKEGRLVLPELLRSRLDLTPGTTLVVERETDGETYLRVQKSGEAKPEKATRFVDKEGVLVVRGRPSGAVANDVAREERDMRVADLHRRTGT